MNAATLQFYASDLQPITHVAAAIGAIDLPKCVASSGTPEKIHHGLTCAGLYDLLAPNIFSASQVARGKMREQVRHKTAYVDARCAR